MITDAALRLIISEPQTLFTTGRSLPGVLPFSVSFLFFMFQIYFPFFLRVAFFAEGWLLLTPDSSSNMLWNEFARVWMEIPDGESEAIDLDSNMEVKKKMKVADDKCLLVSDFDV